MITTSHILAQLKNPVLPGPLGSGSYANSGNVVGALLSNIISILFLIAFLTGLIFLITGGFFWITSGGDKANLENARNRIIHAILGIVVTAAVWAITITVGQFLGLDFTKLPIPIMGQ
ncbi:hypothetical protein HY947_06600 [Candidatus Gottesmanbacteria bacterium]|nr:hypothetical protein [Candidatus Gottesmanbacteria bacterium]